MDLTEKDEKIKVEPLGLLLGKHKNCCNDGPKGLSIREAAASLGYLIYRMGVYFKFFVIKFRHGFGNL